MCSLKGLHIVDVFRFADVLAKRPYSQIFDVHKMCSALLALAHL
jgi:hypothetical protein